MLSSFSSRSSQRVALTTLSKFHDFSSSLTITGNFCKSLSNKRFYGSGHHDEAPKKPYTQRSAVPFPEKIELSEEQRQQKISKKSGYIFGQKVVYYDPLKPLPLTPEQEDSNGWIWNEPPPKPGQSRRWADWEKPTYVFTVATFLVCCVYVWAVPELGITYWAKEEAKERMIIRARHSRDASL